MQVALTSSEYAKDEKPVVDFYERALEKIKAVPGIEYAGAINNLPLGGYDTNGTLYITNRPDPKAYGGFRVVSPDYYRAMGIALIAGRFFTEQDSTVAPGVAIIAQGEAKLYWPSEDPLGKQIKFVGMDNKDILMTVVGIVGDVKHKGLDSSSYPEVYMPIPQRANRARYMTMVIKTKGDPATFAPTIRSVVQS